MDWKNLGISILISLIVTALFVIYFALPEMQDMTAEGVEDPMADNIQFFSMQFQ